jgi:hypothetical protein
VFLGFNITASQPRTTKKVGRMVKIAHSAIAIEGSFLIFPSSDQADSYQRERHFRGWGTTLYPGFSSGG